MPYKLKKDLSIPAGTIFDSIDKSVLVSPHQEATFGVGPDATARLVVDEQDVCIKYDDLFEWQDDYEGVVITDFLQQT